VVLVCEARHFHLGACNNRAKQQQRMIHEPRCMLLNGLTVTPAMPFVNAADLPTGCALHEPGFIGLSARLGRNLNRTCDSSTRALHLPGTATPSQVTCRPSKQKIECMNRMRAAVG
jgi:hypothetical protein